MFGVPPPPHVDGGVQVPQSSTPPQPSAAGPQLKPSFAQVVGVHVGAPQTPGVPPPPQVAGELQLPQSMRPPQPSPAGPHFSPRSVHVLGVQGVVVGAPHLPETPPPPHVAGAVQSPQYVEPPQPSPTQPHE